MSTCGVLLTCLSWPVIPWNHESLANNFIKTIFPTILKIEPRASYIFINSCTSKPHPSTASKILSFSQKCLYSHTFNQNNISPLTSQNCELNMQSQEKLCKLLLGLALESPALLWFCFISTLCPQVINIPRYRGISHQT